jgi:hypothetical protein
VPCDTPVTSPIALTVAEGEELSHVPPVVPLVVNKIDEPTHTVVGPLMVPAFEEEFTDTANEDEDAPQILVTV